MLSLLFVGRFRELYTSINNPDIIIADDPSIATVCTTNGIKAEFVIHFVDKFRTILQYI